MLILRINANLRIANELLLAIRRLAFISRLALLLISYEKIKNSPY